MSFDKYECAWADMLRPTLPRLLKQRSQIMANDKERHDPQPDHGRGPPDGKGRPDDHGRPVPPHKSGATIFGRTMKLK